MNQLENVKQAFIDIEQGVKQIYQSDNYRQYLKFIAKFHDYSFNNTMLILMQCPSASYVAGYSAWKTKFHRQVNKGEKAIKVLAPYQIKITNEDNEEETITKFRMVNVFDISQTSGEPIPEPIETLHGTSYNSVALKEAILKIIKIPVLFHNKDNDPEIAQGIKGYYAHEENVIVIDENLEDIHITKTLVHEYVHSILHQQSNKKVEQKEIEAESLAYVICNHFGIDTKDYSFGYIASYADSENDDLKIILDKIQVVAHQLIDLIEPYFDAELFLLKNTQENLDPLAQEKLLYPLINKISQAPTFKKNMSATDINCHLEVYFGFDDKFYQYLNKHQHLLNGVIKWLAKLSNGDPKIDHPILETSLVYENYRLLKLYAQPIIDGEAIYICYEASGMMDFNIEIIGENHLALSHYYELNGDLLADPDITLSYDPELQILKPLSYQQDNLAYYIETNDQPELIAELNHFLNQWLRNIQACNYQIKRIIKNEE